MAADYAAAILSSPQAYLSDVAVGFEIWSTRISRSYASIASTISI